MDQKDHLIQALQEMVLELTNKLINMRVAVGLELEKKQTEMEKQKMNGDTDRPSAAT